MAFLFATSFYLSAILFYSISHCVYIGRTEGSLAGWSYGSHAGFGGYKAAAPAFGEICNRFNFIRSHKLICLFCKGIDPACFMPKTTTQPPTTLTSTTTPSTTVTTTTAASTTIPTTTTTTTTTTAAPEE